MKGSDKKDGIWFTEDKNGNLQHVKGGEDEARQFARIRSAAFPDNAHYNAVCLFRGGVEYARNNSPKDIKPVPEEFLKWLNAFVEVSDLSGIDDEEEAWTWPAPPNYPDVFAGYPVLTVGVLRSLHAAMINAAEPPKDCNVS